MPRRAVMSDERVRDAGRQLLITICYSLGNLLQKLCLSPLYFLTKRMKLDLPSHLRGMCCSCTWATQQSHLLAPVQTIYTSCNLKPRSVNILRLRRVAVCAWCCMCMAVALCVLDAAPRTLIATLHYPHCHIALPMSPQTPVPDQKLKQHPSLQVDLDHMNRGHLVQAWISNSLLFPQVGWNRH